MLPDELSIIERFFRPLAGQGAFGLRDDAARLTVPEGRDLVITADMLTAGIHFLPSDPADTIAQKALRVNVSDLAAKGAEPLAYTLSIGLGPDADENWLERFADGLGQDQTLFGMVLLGGDTISAPGGTVIAVTAFGAVPAGRMVHRFRGQAGDALYVTGFIGAGAAGLALLQGRDGPWNALASENRDRLIRRYRQPEPRVELAAALREFAAAAMDVSDGLVGDCDKLAGSSGCSARLSAEAVPLPPGLGGVSETELGFLLTAGDDYEILAAIRPADEHRFRDAARQSGIPVSRIGSLTEGSGPTEVLFDGRPMTFYKRAYSHGGGDS